MLVQGSQRPGATIGVNGLAGNLGIAVAALLTGLLVKAFGWRAAFFVPGLACLGVGLLFAWLTPRETEPPSQRGRRSSTSLTVIVPPKPRFTRTFESITKAMNAITYMSPYQRMASGPSDNAIGSKLAAIRA